MIKKGELLSNINDCRIDYAQIITQLMLILCTSCLYRPLGPSPPPPPLAVLSLKQTFSAFLLPGCCSACRGRVLEVNCLHLCLCRNKEAYLKGSWEKPPQEPWLIFQEYLVMSRCPCIRARGMSPMSVTSALRAGDRCSGRGRRSPAGVGMAARPLHATPIQFVHAMRWPACPISMS